MNGVYCDLCKNYVHRNTLWKRNKSDKHINSLRYEQVDNFVDIIRTPEWLFRERRVRGFVNPFYLKVPLSDEYNVIILHHNPIDLNSEINVVGKYNQYITQVHIIITVKQIAIKHGEHIKQFRFKIKVYANVRYEDTQKMHR